MVTLATVRMYHLHALLGVVSFTKVVCVCADRQ
jgi:hypothetical protein